MRLYLLPILVTTVLLAHEAIAQSPKPTSPQETVSSFYTAYLKTRTTGLPGSKELNQLKPYLSKRLVALILQARDEQQRYIKKHPDDKPPWIEGDLFSSLFEGPGKCAAAETTITGDKAKALVRFTYIDSKTPGKPFAWQDAVYLVKEHGQWCIDDIEYLGRWDFAPKGKLSESLKAKVGH